MKICIDPGHGMANRKAGTYEPGACAAGETEAGIVMTWGNCLREVLIERGHKVVRTRVDDKDAAPIGKRASIAKDYGCQIMISLHCNAFNGLAEGTETFYRGEENKAKAYALNAAVIEGLGTRGRGVKTEGQSQHTRLAVMSFQPCFLIELGFIDHDGDRAKMLDTDKMRATCEKLAHVIVS